jgi:hypothetical protein
MALQLDEEYKGFVANYHRITDVRVDYKTSTTNVELSLYKDKAERDEDSNNVLTKSRLRIPKLVPIGSTDDLRAELYAEIKDLVTGIELDEESGQHTEIKKYAEAVDI